ncbi:MAG: merR regulatory family protein [Conexibacter sp.]|nr:merR regulatory family protein [Conexibacter sp.]
MSAIDDGEGMTIGALAEVTGASVRSLRHYEDHGVLSSERGHNGYRRYGTDAVERVVLIRTLLSAGLCMKGVRDALPDVHLDSGTAVPGPELVDRLTWERDRLSRAIGQLESSRAVLEGLIARAGGAVTGEIELLGPPASAQVVRATIRQASI